jgi:hypothetical protein
VALGLVALVGAAGIALTTASGQARATNSDAMRDRLRMAPIARVDPCWSEKNRAAFPAQPQYKAGLEERLSAQMGHVSIARGGAQPSWQAP